MFGNYLDVKFVDLPREQARKTAKQYLERYPKQGYDTHISHWQITNDQVTFVMRRLRNCD